MITGYLSIYSCHLQVPSSMSYSFKVQIFLYLTSLVKFILGYIFFFYEILNGVVLLLSLSHSSLLVYTKAMDFCILILCYATLLNSNTFLMETLGFLKYSIMSLQIVTVLLFPSNIDSFIYFTDCCSQDLIHYFNEIYKL